jgi:hypothetical protein
MPSAALELPFMPAPQNVTASALGVRDIAIVIDPRLGLEIDLIFSWGWPNRHELDVLALHPLFNLSFRVCLRQ